VKEWSKSKTLVFNAAMSLLTVVELKLHLLQPYLPENYFVIVAIAVPAVNIFLRTVTTQPITFMRGSDAE
jgi:hypothetical protein